jgi:hypothetical protein
MVIETNARKNQRASNNFLEGDFDEHFDGSNSRTFLEVV